MIHYDEKLQELQQQVARKAHLESILKDLQSQREELDKKVAELKRVMENEQADVECLEGRSLTAFFYGVVGRKDEKLDKERQEAYAAAVKYDAAVREFAAIEEDIINYNAECRSLYGCENSYEQMLKEKAESVKATGTPEAAKIMQLEEKMFYFENQKKEIKEAISAGKNAQSIANAVLSSLDDAEGWGTWDVFGGGLISDVAKHGVLDDAQERVEQLQVQLCRFKTELADVTIHADMQVNVDGFLRFADYFFDGLFADWAVLDHIGQSKEQVQKTKTEIESVLSRLSLMFSNVENEQAQAKRKLDELIVKAAL